MDVMQLRRNLLMQLIGGSGMIGELSKYQSIKVTPSTTAELVVSHSLGAIPKIVIINGSPDFSGGTAFLSHGILDQRCGNCLAGSGNSINAFTVLTNTTGTSNSYAYLNTSSVTIRRATSARYFDTNCEYTVELYA